MRLGCRIQLCVFCIIGFAGIASSQKVVSIQDTFEQIELNAVALARSFSVKAQIAADSVWASYESGDFLPFNQVIDKPRWSIGMDDIWMVFIAENKRIIPISIYVKSQHAPKQVFKIRNKQLEPVPYLGHAAQFDANQLMLIKERNGFTSSIAPGGVDTFLVNLQIIEAGESKKFMLYNVATYSIHRLLSVQWATLLNGFLIGVLITFLFSSLYFYFRIKETFLLWYIGYLIIFIFYYWRDLEFWNTHFDWSHQWLSWFTTKTPITLLIFLFYLLFINGILGTRVFSSIKIFVKGILVAIPVLWICDIILIKWYPYGSILLAYASGMILGMIQMALLVPIWKNSIDKFTARYLIWGSIFLFGGWLTILFLPVEIHQYTVRFFTLLEMVCFMLAITDRFLNIKNENIEIKLKQTKIISAERERISGELHDEVRSMLSGIAMYSHLAKEQIKANKTIEINQSLDIMHQASSDMVNKLNDIVWFIQPEHDTLEKLLERLTDYTYKMAAIKDIRVKINMSDYLSNIVLPIGVRRNIYLLFKEAINNVVKYSKATLIEFQVTNGDKVLHMLLKDNGVGYDTQNSSKGNGIHNMQKRAKEIGAALDIISSKEKGTEISIKLEITLSNSQLN